MSSLKATNLVCGFGDKVVVDAGSFNLETGELLAVVGPNGGGKSTLLRTLCGRLDPISGEVEISGFDLVGASSQKTARSVTMLMQIQPLDSGLTTEELVRLGRTPYLGRFGHLRKEDLEEVDGAIELCRLQELRSRPLGMMSGGERQRARLAMVLAQGTPVMLLDEPTNHLDVAHRYLLYEIVSEIRKERGCAIVMVSHSLEDARRFAERIMFLNQGKCQLFARNEMPALREAIIMSAGVPDDWVY